MIFKIISKYVAMSCTVGPCGHYYKWVCVNLDNMWRYHKMHVLHFIYWQEGWFMSDAGWRAGPLNPVQLVHLPNINRYLSQSLSLSLSLCLSLSLSLPLSNVHIHTHKYTHTNTQKKETHKQGFNQPDKNHTHARARTHTHTLSHTQRKCILPRYS